MNKQTSKIFGGREKKTLIVTAHPSTHGLTHGIAKVLKEKREEDGGVVEILDLYNTDLKMDYLHFEKVWEIPEDPIRTALQQKITEADELIFIHPVWWLSMPAIMKNFIDQTLMSHFAYKHVDAKRYGMLKGKTARVYVTCDSPILLYVLMGYPVMWPWVAGTLVFCGVDVECFKMIRNNTFKSDALRFRYLLKLKKKSNSKSLFYAIINFIGKIIRI